MYLEVITPEEVLFKGEVSAVQLPGKDGLFQILNDHAPLIATLAIGTVRVRVADDTRTLDHMSSRVILDVTDLSLKQINFYGKIYCNFSLCFFDFVQSSIDGARLRAGC